MQRSTAPRDEPSSRRQSSTTLWAAAGGAVLALIVAFSLATGSDEQPTRPPLTDGSDCVDASSREIRAWVKKHSSEIPAGLSTAEVAAQVEKACERGLAIFNSTLLATAVNSAAAARASTTSP